MGPARRRVRLGLIAAIAAAVACGPRPVQEPSRLVVAYPYTTSTLVSFRSAAEIPSSILRNAYEPLVDLAADLSIVPCLAESWYNPDELTWVFTLRRGVRLHDGRTMEAPHVAEFLRVMISDPSVQRGPGRLLTSVEAPDDLTLRLRTARPVGWLPPHLARVLIGLEGDAGRPPVGTGPYRITRWAPGRDIEMEAFAGHRDGLAPIRRLIFRAIPDQREAVQRLRAGEVDLVLDPPLDDWLALRAEPRMTTFERPSLRVVYLGFDSMPVGRGSPVRDRRVRRAIQTAIDREALIEGPLRGQAILATAFAPLELFGAGRAWPWPTRDTAEARRLIRAAGAATAEAVHLDFQARAFPQIEAVAETIRSQIEQIGLRVELRPRELGAGPRPPGTDLYLLGWLHSFGDAGISYEYLVHTPSTGSLGALSSYSNPDVDRLLAEAARPIPMPDRRADLDSVADLLREDVAILPLYRPYDRWVYASGLEFEPRLDRRVRAREIRWKPGAAPTR
jgi:peptide/nickel transport system substrate-binding protein